LPRDQPDPGGNRVSSFVLLTVVALAPLPFGSTDNVVIATWCVLLGLALVLASLRNLRREQLLPLGLVGLVVLAYFFVLHEQLAERPWTAAAPNSIWSEASKLLGKPLDPSVSSVRFQAFFAIGAPLAAMLAFSTSYVICSDRHRAHQLLRVIAWSGVAYAVVGIALYLADPTQVLWRDRSGGYASASFSATFVNRNTAAVYFGSCAVVCLLLLLRELNGRGRSAIAEISALGSEILRRPRELGPPLLMLIICITAMLMAASRAGTVFSILGLIAAFASFYLRRSESRRNLPVAVLGAILLAVVVLQVFGGSVGSRFNESGFGDAARFDTYRSTLHLIFDHPWLGTGLGSFEWSFPSYRGTDASIWGIWNRTHNTLLEIAADLGLPMAGLVAVLWGLAMVQLWRGIRIRRRDIIIPAAAFSAAVIALLHSTIEFSLQIPGYAIVIFALMGAGIAQSYSSSRPEPGLR
jgi:hypothetical protein